MFSNASNFVHGVDTAFAIILGVSIFFLITLTTLMLYFVFKYNKKRHPKAEQVKDNMWLEATWTTIPLILVFIMFYYGWRGFIPMRQAPDDALQIKAIGKMWKWSFEYPGSKSTDDTLLVPLNKPVKLSLVSTDVLHGFSVPAFRIKEDVVPYKKNYTWFVPGEVGDYDIYCTVYCGLNHSYMYAVLRVLPEDEYNKTIAKLPVKKAQDSNLGYKTLEKNGCLACHSLNGSKLVGPSLKGIYGTTVDVTTNGAKRKATVDDEYIKTAIFDPNKDVHEGFPTGVMKSYKGIITDKEAEEISKYLKELK